MIAATRELVWARDSACRKTGVAHSSDEMHELISRAMLRGKPPEEIFNTVNCVRLSRAVHRLVTDNKLRIVFDPVLGGDSEITFVKGGKHGI